MNYRIKEALKDMKDYRKLGELAENRKIGNRPTFTQYIRSLIRGNDALCLYFLNEAPSDHRKSHLYFQRLYDENHIPGRYNKYQSTIQLIMQEKSDIEYSPSKLSSSTFEKYKKKVIRYIDNVVKPIFEREGFNIEKV